MMKKIVELNIIKNTFYILFIFCIFGIFQLFAQVSRGKGYLVDQRAHWVSVITDPDIIQLFIDEFYLSPEDKIVKIEIFDLNNNGFSKGDVFKTYPDEEIYHLEDPSVKLQSVMDNWEFQANFSLTGENVETTPEDLMSRPFNKAGNAIVASLLEGLDRNYMDWPVEIWLHRDSTGLKFEMWAYNEDELKYQPPPPAFTLPDTVTNFDLLHLFRSDTLFVTDTTLYDFLYIYKSVSDTVFIPGK